MQGGRAPTFRRTRIVCLADTHNATVKLPKGDVLIHAGDLTNQGSYSELSKAVKWLEAADFEAKIVIAGNHDITLGADFYSQHGAGFHNQNRASPGDCVKLLTSSPSITYLEHESTTVQLRSPTGPHTRFKVFGSPYSPRRGHWAFCYDAPADSSDARLTRIWDGIPADADIVVTHTPPRGYGDATSQQGLRGCEALRRALRRVRPRLAVCGHIHDGRGARRVRWDGGPEGASAAAWEDPGLGNNNNNKVSLLDLTSKTTALAPGETCVVNAAVMKSRYPHRGGKEFNKPIVVDVDLPVWAEERQERVDG
ncbi:uncharacterized protein UV8b_05480 [Ustilaginoidea virens]|uniref:Calcineurin-like phosphoesterase domain-containing protein n=1 Tax=Ustilaginoidea virens TaxID=1159556 RepID=A0A1B5L3Y4_USTVR|nr:uncharacterized protein UV8b_05480 [Ustilaginoidea virens]QUC21237.1 hypothetical protein UV8b_05480 [Ustilaginoidea virens]GAO17218.1 hypothetical protein UVI_02057440 [Ustilaginoidea virens]